MLSEKKKRSNLGLHVFLRNSWCPLKKKKDLHFDFIFYFPIFLPKSGSSLKKKWSSLPFALSFPYFSPKIRVFSKKRKGLHSESFSEQTSAADSKLYVLFSRGSLRRPPHLPHPISTTEYLGTLIVIPIAVPSQKNLGGNKILPKFCDVFPNHDFIVHYGYEKKIFCDSQTKNQFGLKIMVISRAPQKKRKGLHLNLVIIFCSSSSSPP